MQVDVVAISSRVVKGRAGIRRGRWSLVSYPVNAAGRLLDPLTEVDIKCAGEVAGCWGSADRARAPVSQNNPCRSTGFSKVVGAGLKVALRVDHPAPPCLL